MAETRGCCSQARKAAPRFGRLSLNISLPELTFAAYYRLQLARPDRPLEGGLDETETIVTESALEVEPEPGAPVPKWDLDDPSLYLNRELSWLEFNQRVLAEALDARNPLLERVKFLAIAASNLDEFYTKRLGWLKQAWPRTSGS
jgi:hypothetical protein